MNYNTNQWTIFNYPTGAGGKVLTTYFSQFKKMAHWSEQSLTLTESIAWYINSLPGKDELWPMKEIDTPWKLPNISRSWPRGGDTTEAEFNQLVPKIKNEYFHRAWEQGLIIPDFWHKTKHPAWWSQANCIGIYIDDIDLYKKLLFSKLFEFKNNTVTDILQRPDTGDQERRKCKEQFKNAWCWENVSSIDEFFEATISQFPWYTGWDFTAEPQAPTITVTELFDVDKVYNFLLQFEEQYEQKIDRDFVKSIHHAWVTASLIKINSLKDH